MQIFSQKGAYLFWEQGFEKLAVTLISLDRLCLNLELEFWIEKNQGALIQTRSSDLRLRFGKSIRKFFIRNRVIRNLGSGFGIVY